MDHLWPQILSFYWPGTSNYAVETEPYASETSLTANVALTTLHQAKIYKCLFIECNRSKQTAETHDIKPKAETWETSQARLERDIGRWTERDHSIPVYGIISIGLDARFLVMPAWRVQFEPYSRELADLSVETDFARIDRILREIRGTLAIMSTQVDSPQRG